MIILGISAFYHDSAAAVLADGHIVAAAQEERFTRRKHDARFPAHAVRYCLDEVGASLDDVDHVVFFEKPFMKFERLLETYVQFAPRGFNSFRMAMPLWIKEKLFQKTELKRLLRELGRGETLRNDLLFSEHHLSHAASSFYPSPFEEAAVLTMDGVGEWATTTLAVGRGSDLRIEREIPFPNSLGLLYSAFTYHTGFRVNSGEYKLMGLAPYGEPRFADRIREHLIDVKPDGSFRLDQRYFNYCTGLTMTSARFDALFEAKPRRPESPLEQHHMDMAASVQVVVEDVVVRLARDIRERTGQTKLCLAGGVALNCVANGRLRREGIFDDIWIQPAAGDAGGALGAALYAHHAFLGGERRINCGDAMRGAYLGPSYTQGEIVDRLAAVGARFEVVDDEEILRRVAADLAEGRAVGWFQDRMEFGPRALGNRSILGDPRSPTTQRTLNLKIKYRESFRPFAPSVLEEAVGDWFDLDGPSPYMLLVDDVREDRRVAPDLEVAEATGLDLLNQVRSEIPAVTHVDHSARIQTVSAETNPRYHRLISIFRELTGVPVLVNTSFNVRGEPIVATPEDAFRCFMGTEMDVLAVGDCYLKKRQQDADLKKDYKREFALD
ncbi:MAG: carbamoyltransferase [Pseudomonadota bacterium]